ncbi:MAG: flagellar basal body-associated FliL family protein [Deltaproteobacteria bacterium]|nr:flagellar basal body-associated FliL family protein [Deltaproteobacteria bacterium]MBW2307933.1 flagellar basal body-associated FliL family protein [Deltaproteobacteria bacterium]
MAENEEIKEKETQVPEKKKRSLLTLIIIALVVLTLLGGGGFFAWKNFMTASRTSEADARVAVKDEPGIIIPLDTFIINLADAEDQRYLKVVIKLETWDPAVNEEIQKRMAQLRDAIITLLTTQTYQDVATFKGKTFLRAEIKKRINQYIRKGSIQKVYFTDFVIQ